MVLKPVQEQGMGYIQVHAAIHASSESPNQRPQGHNRLSTCPAKVSSRLPAGLPAQLCVFGYFQGVGVLVSWKCETVS